MKNLQSHYSRIFESHIKKEKKIHSDLSNQPHSPVVLQKIAARQKIIDTLTTCKDELDLRIETEEIGRHGAT